MKLIVLDMDGTLLNQTAILEEAAISCPVISLNGAETRDVEGNLLASRVQNV